MKVELLAFTTLNTPAKAVLEPELGITGADHLVELAGRACYDSFSRPNPATARNKRYLANILAQGHYSVLEHSSASFYVTEVSRTLTHELVRHRHLSYSQRSQRYVDESQSGFVVPEDLRGYPALVQRLAALNEEARDLYRLIVGRLSAEGLTRKEARGAARAALLNATHTDIVVTGNMRAWRDFLTKRLHPSAEIEIRTLAQEILRHLKMVSPNTFQDFSEFAGKHETAIVESAKGE